MNNIEILINEPANAHLDMDSNFDMALQYSIADIRDISKRNAAFSKTVVLPGTKNNNYWFGNLFDINSDFTYFNPNKKTPAKVLVNTKIVLDGFLQLKNIKKLVNVDQSGNLVQYEVVLFNNAVDLMTELGEKTLFELDLSEYKHSFTKEAVEASWSHTWEQGYVYPIYGEPLKTYQYDLDWLYPSSFYKAVLDRILQEAGYGWTGSFKENEQFDKEIISFVKDGNVFIDENEKLRRQFRAGSSNIFVDYGRTVNSFSSNTQLVSPFVYRYDDTSTSPNFDNSNNWNTTVWEWTLDQTGNFNVEVQFDYDIRLTNDTSEAMTFQNLAASQTNLPVTARHFLEKSTNGGTTWTTLTQTNINTTFTNNSIPANSSISRNIFGSTTLQDEEFFVGTKVRLRVQIVKQPLATYFNFAPGAPSLGGFTCRLGIDYKGGTTNFFKNDALASVIGQGSDVNLSQFLPDKIKQKDLISDLIKRYNLYIEVSPDNSRLLIFNERPNFYRDDAPILDWTQKLDMSSEIKYTLLSELQFKEGLWTYKIDNDTINQLYLSETGDIYGQRKFIFDNDFVKGEKRIESPFAATPLIKTTWGAYLSSINPEEPKIQPRVLYFGGTFSGANWELSYLDPNNPATTLTQTYNYYPYTGHFDNPVNPRLDINFGENKKYFYTDWDFIPTANMYNTYWADYTKQIETGRLMTAKFHLDEEDINFVKDNFNSKIFIIDSYYYLNKITDFKPLNKSTTTVELIKIDDGIKWVNSSAGNDVIGATSACPIDMISQQFKGVWYYVSASGATVSQECCDVLGGFWDGKACRAARPVRPVGGTLNPVKPILDGGLGNNGTGVVIGNGNVIGGKVITEDGFIRDNYPIVQGDNNIVHGRSVISSGDNNQVSGNDVFIMGDDSVVEADNVFAFATRGQTFSEPNKFHIGDNFTVDTDSGSFIIDGVPYSPNQTNPLSDQWESIGLTTSAPVVEEFSINSATWSDITQVKIQQNSINDDRGDLLQYALTAESVFIEITNTKDQSIYGVFLVTSAAFEFGSVYSFNVSPVTTGQNPDIQDPTYSPIFTISFSFGFNPPTPSLSEVLAVGNTASGPILLENGSAAAPAYSFSNATQTGLYLATNLIGFSVNNATRFIVASSYVRSLQAHRFADGTAAGPTITFHNDLDTGIYRPGDNLIAFSTNGVERLRIGANATFASNIRSVDGSDAVPGIAFASDTDTGIYRPDTNRLGIAAGGELIADFRPSGAYFEKNIILKAPNGSQWELSVDNSGNLITTAVS